MKNLLAFGLFFLAFSSANLVYAETELVTDDELVKIEQRVNSMDYNQLNERKAFLIEEKNNVDLVLDSTSYLIASNSLDITTSINEQLSQIDMKLEYKNFEKN